MVVVGHREELARAVRRGRAPASLGADHGGVGESRALGEARVEHAAEEARRALLPGGGDALGVHVVVEEIRLHAHPGVLHLAGRDLPGVGRRPLDVGEVEVERLAGVRIGHRLVRGARIAALAARELDLDAGVVVHPRHRAGAQPVAVAVAVDRVELLLDGLVAHPQVALPLPAREPTGRGALTHRTGKVVRAAVHRVLQLGVDGLLRGALLGLRGLELREPLLQRLQLRLERAELLGGHGGGRRSLGGRRGDLLGGLGGLREASRPRGRRDHRDDPGETMGHVGLPVRVGLRVRNS